MTPGTPTAEPGYALPATRVPDLPSHVDPDFAHRTRTNTRTPLEPIGYDSEGAPLWPWQVMDGD